MPRPVAPALFCAVLLVGCSVAPSPSASPPAASAGPVVNSTPSGSQPTPSPTQTSTASLPPLPPSASLPVEGVATSVGTQVQMAAGVGGSLWVSVPAAEGVVLSRLEAGGSPAAGWPILLAGASPCGFMAAVDDGSVRVVCQFPGELQTEGPPPERAYAFDAGGRLQPGWPVTVPCCFVGRVIGNDLTLFAQEVFGTDFVPDEPIPGNTWILTVGADGTVRNGEKVPYGTHCCPSLAIGPDGVGHKVTTTPLWELDRPEVTEITAIDMSGVVAGWPVTFDGIASDPAFTRDGRPLLTVGSFANPTSRVVSFDRGGVAVAASSAVLPMGTAESGVDCVAGGPEPPVVADDGTTFVFSEIDGRIFALGPGLAGVAGWPIEPAPGLLHLPPPPDAELWCSPPARPAAGPDARLVLSLFARNDAAGGAVVALARDGRAIDGWPVELQKPGAYFWTIVVGPDGTAYALAIEPEGGTSSSASILAFAPDSTVRYTTTIVEP